MQSTAASVEAYLAELPPERVEVVSGVLDLVRSSLQPGYEEGMGYGMVTWTVPLSVYPDTYNKQPMTYAALASQKQYVSLYLMVAYLGAGLGEEQIRARWAGGKPLNMGKSCVRFKALGDLDLPLLREVLGQCGVDEYVALARAARAR